MCGITGIFTFNLVGKFNKIHSTAATMSLGKRGPDHQHVFIDDQVALGHRRLSIIDTSTDGNQPMWDSSGRYCIVFNGEIFNYLALREKLGAGIALKSRSDTEVLLYLYIQYKERCLDYLNGFFSFCIYDQQEQSFFLARDRYGEKPLLYVHDEDKFIFASEMKSILQYGIGKEIDYDSLFTYLQLNYIPAPATIFRNVKKLSPGHYIKLTRGSFEIKRWYSIKPRELAQMSYEEACKKFQALLEASVKRRLIADVPLGAFLSGGIDSSVVAGLASRHTSNLHTFSIGFRDEKFFDETHYARLVAKHFNTEHTVFSLTNDDLFANVNDVLEYLDEPFADSSALNVYILSKQTRKHATVALSGDGADELLGGYNKHSAFLRLLQPGLKEKIAISLTPLWGLLPQSRNGKISNVVRQLKRFSDGARLTKADRYWKWAGYASEGNVTALLSESVRSQLNDREYAERKGSILHLLREESGMNEIFQTDMELVLPNDMLMKVDMMSMANSLEVRSPFLDVELVDFCFTLPETFKITPTIRKRVLQDSFRSFLPKELYNRPKKGFEVPLLKWFRKEMRSMIFDDLLSSKFIMDQGIFNNVEIEKLKSQLLSNNPADVHARIWALIVFQSWWKRYCS